MPQKTARKKLLMMRNGTPPDVGPPLRRGAYGVRSPRPENGHLLAPRVDQLAHLSGTERQGCSWGASRDSGGRAAAQPPCACTRTQKVPWRPCSCVQLAAPRCPRRPPAWPCHQSRRQNKQQRKTGSYGSAGRQHQVATLPSSSAMKAPFASPSAAMLSAHQFKHESQSTRRVECSAKRPAPRSM